MNFFLSVITGMLENLLTDFTKKVLDWRIVSEKYEVTPSQKVDASELYALRVINHERLQSIQSASMMALLCFLFLATAAYLPVVFGNFPAVTINLADTRLNFLTNMFNISHVNIYYFVFFLVAVAYIPLFLFTQLLTKTIAWFVNYNFSNVSKSGFVFFFVSSMLPVTILFATAVTYLYYPGMEFWDCFTYSFLLTVILLGYAGLQARP